MFITKEFGIMPSVVDSAEHFCCGKSYRYFWDTLYNANLSKFLEFWYQYFNFNRFILGICASSQINSEHTITETKGSANIYSIFILDVDLGFEIYKMVPNY